jgi:release factor glutamine methyltransferase
MKANDLSFQNQQAAIEKMKQRQKPVTNILDGNEITALPNVYAGGLDSELMCEVINIPKDAEVLDLCTGTGVIAVKAAQLGAKRVVAVDLNPEAVKSARLNAAKLQLSQIEVREGSLFEPAGKETFDVIIINPPYINHEAKDKTEICFWDIGNAVTKEFFAKYKQYLKPSGTAYLGWGDFADMNLLDELASEYGVHLKMISSKTDPLTNEAFLAYELREKQD